MAITFREANSSPADNGTQDNSAARGAAFTTAVEGDLLFIAAMVRSSTENMSMLETGGQTWNALTIGQSGSAGLRCFWARHNGNLTATPTVDTTSHLGSAFTVVQHSFAPTSASNTWAIDVAESIAHVGTPSSPYDITITGRTTVAASTVTIAVWASIDDNTWSLQTGGWSQAVAQYRNLSGNDTSLSLAYLVKTSAGATGNVTNRQVFSPGDQGRTFIVTFKEQSSGVTVSNADDELFYHGETGIAVTGTEFGASQGTGGVVIAAADDIEDASAVEQTVTSWADTSISFTADLDTFTPFAQLYLFVRNDDDASNSNGFPVKRESLMYVRERLEDLTGTAAASLSSIRYRVSDTTINGTLLLSGTDATTAGDGDIELGPYTLTEGGDLSTGDDVWLTLAYEGASQAASKGTCVKITPDYE